MVSTRIDWVLEHCRLLRAISAEFGRTRPFDGLTIGTGIHLEAKTVALLLTLRDGGARLVSTGNLNTTQPDAVERLRAEGVTVVGEPTKDSRVHAGYLDEVLAAEPDLILDNGGDLFARYLDRPYRALMGGTEETTSGRMRLEPLRDRLSRPILVINDSPIKQFAENEHAVGQSAVESFLRMTNRVTNGEQVTVFGYGACGRGVAASFRGAYARVSVVDVDPVTRLRAHLDGFGTPPRDIAVAEADLIVTVTGARDVLTAADLPLLRNGVILANAGHFPAEIDAAGLIGAAEVTGTREYADDLLTLELSDGRRIHLLARGHMFNLAGRGRSGTPSSRWTWGSPCRPAAWKRSPAAASTLPAASSRFPHPSTRRSRAATWTASTPADADARMGTAAPGQCNRYDHDGPERSGVPAAATDKEPDFGEFRGAGNRRR